MNRVHKEFENITEEGLINWLVKYLDYAEVINDEFPTKGASSWYPYGYFLIKNLLSLASTQLIEKVGFDEIVLPSFVHGEDFMKECRHIKDFSERVYWSPLYKKDDLHVVTPTIEAQLGSLYAIWLQNGKKLPFKYFTVRGVGRYETGRTIPLWKERNVWPFFEGLTAHDSTSDFSSTIQRQVKFMKSFFEQIGIPILIIERPKIHRRLREYSERRIEAITITKDRRIVILANIYDLGEIFSKVYDICYFLKRKKNYALTSAIGLSGRVLAVLLAINGDTQGFVIPPSLAPIKLAIVPVYNKPELHIWATETKNYLLTKSVTSKVFPATTSFGERRKKVAAMGIPFFIEIGPNEIKNSEVIINHRTILPPIKTKVDKLPFIINTQSKKLEEAIKKKAVNSFISLNRFAESKKVFIRLAKDEFLTCAPFCDQSTCHEGACKLSNKEIIGRSCEETQKIKNRCIICKNMAIQNLYFGVKWKGEK